MPNEESRAAREIECGCGCRQRISSVGTNGKPRRFVYGHSRRSSANEYEVRELGYNSPCWIWLRSYNQKGYGSGWANGKTEAAHRIVFRRHRGEIPDGLVLDHLCRNRGCVNPDHLEPVPLKLNVRRGVLAKLTLDSIAEMRQRAALGEGRQSLAAAYGVSIGYVWDITSGRRG